MQRPQCKTKGSGILRTRCSKLSAELGASVVALDIAPVEGPCELALEVDLRERASVDAALERIEGPIHAVFSCAGIADGPAVMRVNFIGHRHVIDRLIEKGALGRGSAICLISSVAGIGWETDLPRLVEFLATPDFDSGSAWVDAHPDTNQYMFSKQAINAYVAREALGMQKRGIRINAVCPGPTDTPLAQANADMWLSFASDYRAEAGIEYLSPDQIASTMAFLNSPASNGVSGVTLLVDSGHVMASISGGWAADQPLLDILRGKTS